MYSSQIAARTPPAVIRSGIALLAFIILLLGQSAEGQEIRWQPVHATGNIISISDSPPEIVLSRGGVTVTLFMQVSGWDKDRDGDPSLGAFQGALDATTLEGPGDCDLTTDATGQFRVAFQALKVCASDIYDPEGSFDPLLGLIPGGGCHTFDDCPASHPYCVDRPDYVYYQLDNTPTVSTATPNFTWSSASTDCMPDPGGGKRFYGGTLLVEVPDLCCPDGWDVGFVEDSNFTLFNSCPGPLIPFGEGGIVPGHIGMETGSCCFGLLTADAGCIGPVCAADCDARPGPRVFRPGVDCSRECHICFSAWDCRDPYWHQYRYDNLCTDDYCCEWGTCCSHVDNYEVGIECCDPETGDTTPIDDGNPCTDDWCDAEWGVVGNDPNTDACNDGDGCTQSDRCSGGVCAGTDINETACTNVGPAGSDSACDFGDDGSYPCEFDPARQGNFCKCSLCTSLIVDASASVVKDANCYEEGEEVSVTVSIGPGSERVTGAQFILTWEPDCLDFQSMGPCDGSVFSANPIKDVRSAAGEVFYVSLIEPFKRCDDDSGTLAGEKCFDDGDCNDGTDAGTCVLTVGSKGPADLACASFLMKDHCDKCPLCLDGENPENIILSNDEGHSVDICDPITCDAVRLAGDISITVPGGALVQADCGVSTAVVEWDMPFATDTCDDPDPQVVCTGSFLNVFGLEDPLLGPDDLVWNGGEFTQGHWWFVCDAENSCGNTDREVWTVYVKDQHMLDVEVELGPPLTSGQLQRCICFDLYTYCWDAPTHACTELTFGPPENFKRHARGQLKIAKSNYLCIAAADPLHTLRQSSDVACVNNAWTAVWKGDPLLGGNWLPGGNLDAMKSPDEGSPYVIDVLDFGKFVHLIDIGAKYESGDTTCATQAPHGDINGDGLVDNIDFAIIQMNYLMAKKDECCPDRAAEPIVPITEITVKQLRLAGMVDLIVADLNQDGVLNVKDMETYEAGVRPVQTQRTRKHGTR